MKIHGVQLSGGLRYKLERTGECSSPFPPVVSSAELCHLSRVYRREALPLNPKEADVESERKGKNSKLSPMPS